MNNTKLVSHYFAGANSWKGFYSVFDYIMPNPNKTYILKGGPGTGKSTLLKKLATKAQNNNYDIEKIYCSSDSDSLDGISIPLTGTTIVDGTAPHIIDPLYPGAVEELVDLGKFLNTKLLTDNLDEIKKIQKEIKQLFTICYSYLHQGKLAIDRLQKFHFNFLPNRHWFDIERKIVEKLTENHRNSNQTFTSHVCNTFSKKNHNCNNIRYLFASSFTPQGHINLYPELFKSIDSIVILQDPYFISTDQFMKTLLHRLSKLNKELTVFLCGFNPEQIDCIYLPEHNSACLKSNYYHSFPKTTSSNSYNITRTIKLEEIDANSNHFCTEFNETINQFHSLINSALNHLSEILTVRSELEQIYLEAQNFDAVNQITEELIQKLKLDR